MARTNETMNWVEMTTIRNNVQMNLVFLFEKPLK